MDFIGLWGLEDLQDSSLDRSPERLFYELTVEAEHHLWGDFGLHEPSAWGENCANACI